MPIDLCDDSEPEILRSRAGVVAKIGRYEDADTQILKIPSALDPVRCPGMTSQVESSMLASTLPGPANQRTAKSKTEHQQQQDSEALPAKTHHAQQT